MGTVTHLPQPAIKAVRVSDDITRITRFPKGADANVRREFAQTLVKALDDLGVEPGDDFVIAAYQDELKPQPDPETEPGSGLTYKEVLEQERGEEWERVCAVLLALYDFRLGMIDAGEMLRRVRLQYRGFIREDEMTDELHAGLGLGHTGGGY